MFAALKSFFAADPYQLPAHHAYVALVEQSRLPMFYAEAEVPDTIDGRFDVIALHMFLLSERARPHSPEFVRALWEAFFSDMDRSLREMGASDTGIGKRIKKMVQAFYGRIDAYERTVDDVEAFKETLRRNLYRGVEVSDSAVARVAAYVHEKRAVLAASDTDALLRGEIRFA
jgi:cytochrome b pre-mRNA-processing protein 3